MFTSTVRVCLIDQVCPDYTDRIGNRMHFCKKDSLVMNEKLVFGSFQLKKGEPEKVE